MVNTGRLTSAATENHRRGSITARIRKYLEERPGQAVYTAELMEEFDLTEHQVQGAINNLAKRVDDATIETVLRGQTWRWLPKSSSEKSKTSSAPVSKRMFVEVGEVTGGDIIIQCEDGTLYRAAKL